MNEQTQNNQPLKDQPEGILPPTPGERPPESPPARKFKLNQKFAIGFLGWYLVMALVFWVLLGNSGDIFGFGTCVIFPAQIITLIILLSVKTVRDVGWGMLSAITVNLLISLILGLAFNAICFVPFFTPME